MARVMLDPTAELNLGKEPLANALVCHRVVAGGSGFFERVGGQGEQNFAREGVVLGMEGRQGRRNIERIGVTGDSLQGDADRVEAVLATWAPLRRHGASR